VSARFEELDWRPTPIGEVSLRRRRDPVSGVDIFEAKLGDEFLMSSLFTVAEIEVARLALAQLQGSGLDVAVGGLGLGYTAQAVLADGSAGFYGVEGTQRLAGHVRPGGVYSLWSNDPPDDAYLAVLSQVFVDVAARVVSFPNPLQERTATNTVYLATKPH